MSKVKDLERELEIMKRKEFLDVYNDFNDWLMSIGFRKAKYDEGSMGSYHYSHYEKFVDSLWGVEDFIHDVLKIRVNFVRDRHYHKYMIVGGLGAHSEVKSQDEFKTIITDWVKREVTKLQEQLNQIYI